MHRSLRTALLAIALAVGLCRPAAPPAPGGGDQAREETPRRGEDSVTTRSGLDVVPDGTAGRDWHFEPLYSNRGLDERGVLYLARGTGLEIRPNARDRDPLGAPAEGRGELRYEWAPDGVAGPYLGEDARGRPVAGRLDPWTATVDGEPLTAAEGWGAGRFAERAAQNRRRLRGLRGDDAALVQVLHVWQDDSGWFQGGPNGKVRGSDGLRVICVLGPTTPMLRMQATPGQRYYTTPLRTYHVARLHEQWTYLDPEVEITASSFESTAIEYRIDRRGAQDAWRPWPGPSRARALFGAAGEYVLRLRYRGASLERVRRFVVAPRHAGLAERQEGAARRRTLLFAAEHLRETRAALRAGTGPLGVAYRKLRDLGHYQREDATPLDVRGGFRATSRRANAALRRALIAFVEDDGPRARREAQRAVAELTTLGSVDPLGMENPLWVGNPALERVTLGFEQGQILHAVLAYDLLLQLPWIAAEDGPLTAVVDRRLRDGFASYARLFLQFRDNVQETPGEGDAHWGAAMDAALLHLAAGMPSYRSAYHGVAFEGAGAAGACPRDAPFPGLGISWWDAAHLAHPPATGWPNLRAGSRLPVVYGPDGTWRGPRRYERLLLPFGLSAAILLESRGEAGLRPELRAYASRRAEAGLPLASWPGFGFAAPGPADLQKIDERSVRDPLSLLRVDARAYTGASARSGSRDESAAGRDR